MCRLYAFRGTEPTKVECGLVHAQNALMAQSRQDLSGSRHIHGWGVAAYENSHPHVERQAWAAYHGEHFQRAAARVYATVVIAHIRAATVGEPNLDNTHPFVHEHWTFAHNGTLPGFETVRHHLLEQTALDHKNAIKGQTDSEHLFHFILSRIEAAPERPLAETVTLAASDVIGWCRKAAPDRKIGLNVMLTDGHNLVGTRSGRTLYHLERGAILDCEICGFPHVHHHPGSGYRAVLVASEPITHENWQEMREGSVYTIDTDCRLNIEPLCVTQ